MEDQAMKRRKISSRNIDRHMKAKRTEDRKTQQISQLALIAMLMGTKEVIHKLLRTGRPSAPRSLA